jgi:hypothetical protein
MLLIFGYLLRRLELLVPGLPIVEFLLGQPMKVMVHHLGRGCAVEAFGQNAQVFLGRSSAGGYQAQTYNRRNHPL